MRKAVVTEDSEATDVQRDHRTTDKIVVTKKTVDEKSARSGRSLTIRLPAAPGWPRFLRPVLAVMLLLALAGAAFAWYQQDREETRDKDAEDAARTAAESLDLLLTFRPATVFDELPEEKKLLTGQLADDYENELTTEWGPSVVENGISTEVAIARYGVMDRSDGEVTVLVFANLTRRTAGSDETEIVTSTMRVTMTKVDGDWRISAYEGI